MNATPYSTTQIFELNTRRLDYVTLTVVANGGQVDVELLHDPTGDVWVTAETFTADGGYVIRPGLFTFRVVPSGTAEFNISRI